MYFFFFFSLSLSLFVFAGTFQLLTLASLDIDHDARLLMRIPMAT